MERFKGILKAALAKKAARIKLQVGAVPEVITAQGPEQLAEFGPTPPDLLDKLYSVLFPKDQERLAERMPTRGHLKVVDFGRLGLIAEPVPAATLKIFVPPQGDAMFEKAWEQVNAPAPAATPMAAQPSPTAPPQRTANPVAFEPQDMGDNMFAPPMPSSKTVPPPPPKSQPEPVASGGGAPMPDFGISFHPGAMDAVLEQPAQTTAQAVSGFIPPDDGISFTPSAPVATEPPVAPGGAPGFVPPGFSLDGDAVGDDMMATPQPPPIRTQPPQPASGPQAFAMNVDMDMGLEADEPSVANVHPMQGRTMAEPSSDFGLELPPPSPGLMTIDEPDHGARATHHHHGGASSYQPSHHHHDHHASVPRHGMGPVDGDEDQVTVHFGAQVPGESIEAGVSRPIDIVLRDMVQRKASDLHLTLGEPICLRIDGDIVRLDNTYLSEDLMRQYLLPIMPPVNLKEFAKAHDTDFAYEVPGVARFRVNMFRDLNGVGAVLRQIPSTVLSADQLGLAPAIRKLCYLTKGLVVVTGPTGSGKSTTLAAMVDLINETRSDHILTIEDPVEFVHKQKRCLINQREVHRHTGSFARALKAALREDPDIILIGELRDLETVAIAIETAETGHLVFGTLHTNTAISTVDRVIDQFPADQQEQIRVMLAESLKGVVAQTLIKKIGGGRVAAQEILIVNKAVGSMIREGKTHMIQNHMQTQKAEGNLLMNEALVDLVAKKLISPQDAFMKSVDKEGFITYMRQRGLPVDFIARQSA